MEGRRRRYNLSVYYLSLQERFMLYIHKENKGSMEKPLRRCITGTVLQRYAPDKNQAIRLMVNGYVGDE